MDSPSRKTTAYPFNERGGAAVHLSDRARICSIAPIPDGYQRWTIDFVPDEDCSVHRISYAVPFRTVTVLELSSQVYILEDARSVSFTYNALHRLGATPPAPSAEYRRGFGRNTKGRHLVWYRFLVLLATVLESLDQRFAREDSSAQKVSDVDPSISSWMGEKGLPTDRHSISVLKDLVQFMADDESYHNDQGSYHSDEGSGPYNDEGSPLYSDEGSGPLQRRRQWCLQLRRRRQLGQSATKTRAGWRTMTTDNKTTQVKC